MCDLPVDPQARLVALSSNSKFVASLVGSTVSLYDIELGREVWSNQCRVPWSIKGALCFSPGGETLLVISTKEFSNRTIHLVDTASHQESSFRLPDAMFTGLQFADEESIWLWNNSGTISRWSMSNLDDEYCDDVSCRLVWTRELSQALQ
jgi:sugar lactone lactonase YvrE